MKQKREILTLDMVKGADPYPYQVKIKNEVIASFGSERQAREFIYCARNRNKNKFPSVWDYKHTWGQ